MTALILGALLAAAAVALVSVPFFRGADDMLDSPDEATEKRLEQIDERDRVLAALKELEFHDRTGKIDDTDYRNLVGPLRRAAAEAIQALDDRPAKE